MESLNPAPYSAIADALNKFHTASESIQALALLCVTAMVLGTVWSVCGHVPDRHLHLSLPPNPAIIRP